MMIQPTMSVMQRRFAAMLLAGTAMAMPAAAMAQTATAAADATSAEEIFVTAQHSNQRLIDVPIAITALTGADIANRGVTNLNDAQTAIPGLRIIELGVGTQRIQLRGVSQFLGLPTVGNYIDEFSVNNFTASGSPDIRLLDLERVEVLRGPQPTLYGEGSMGGTIRYVTAKPNLETISGSAAGEVNGVKDGGTGWSATGVINLPIVKDKLALRVAATHEQVGGWVDTPLTTPAGKNVNDTKYTTVRGTLLAKPTDSLSLSLMVLHQYADQEFKNYSNREGVSSALYPSPLKQKYTLGNFVASYDLGGATILASTGLMRLDSRSVDDSGPYYNTYVFGFPYLTSALSDSQGRLDKFSQELRLSSNGTGPLTYLAGVVYTNGKTSSNLVGHTDPAVPGFEYVIDQIDRSRSWAVFGTLGYDFTSAIHLDAGGRYFWDTRSTHGTTVLPNLFGPGADYTIPTDQSGNFHSFNPRVALTIKTGANGTIFANAAKGFRSGGFNTVTNPLVPPSYGPEKLWSYEIGTKQSLFGGKLYAELSAYYNQYDNIQTVSPISGPTITATTNSGKASGPGVDLTLQGRPLPDLTLSGTLGYSHIRYDTNSSDRFEGEPLDLVPDVTYNLAIDYTPQLSDSIGLKAHADFGYSDAARITLHTPSLNQIAYSESRAVLNARLGVDFGKFEAYVFANNLTDTRKIINPAFGGYFEPIYNKPRTIGVGAKANF